MRNNQTLFFILAVVILALIGLWALNAGGPTTTTTPSTTERSATGTGTGEAGKTTTTPAEKAPASK